MRIKSQRLKSGHPDGREMAGRLTEKVLVQKRGKEMLMNNTLSSISYLFMSLLNALTSVIGKIEGCKEFPLGCDG